MVWFDYFSFIFSNGGLGGLINVFKFIKLLRGKGGFGIEGVWDYRGRVFLYCFFDDFLG